jgi:hypothetical protein
MMWILKLILFFYNDFNPYQVNTPTFNNVDTAIGLLKIIVFQKRQLLLFKIVLLNTNTIYWTNDF